MGRIPQPSDSRGSLRWIQRLVNEHQLVLDSAIGLGPIRWLSPLKDDHHAEYRDQAFLDLLEVQLRSRPLNTFWPTKGPQWDALGRAESGEAVLVEAKAHISELFSPPSQASPKSLLLIQQSLRECAAALGASPGCDWSARFYQYANRLAHAYLLHELNEVPTQLVFVNFVGDDDVSGPRTRMEWDVAMQVLHEALGLTGHLPKYVLEVAIDVSQDAPVGV